MGKQIGWFIVDEEFVYHRADFSTAAWWEDVNVRKGKYPITVHDYDVYKDGEVHGQGAYIKLEGTIVADYFGSLYFGMPIGEYDNMKNAGKEQCFSTFTYLFMLADDICKGKSKHGRYELFPEYEAREYTFISCVDGREMTGHGIYLKDEPID